MLETERLVLRPWREDDAEILFQYAKDPRVGPIAGWPPHESVEDSRAVIRDVLMLPETYAILLKGTDEPIGAAGLFTPDKGVSGKDWELGYWLGVPFWGKGLMTEVACCLRDHAFEKLECETFWCAHFEGNARSKRVIEKCGLTYHHTGDFYVPFCDETRKEHVYSLSRMDWQKIAKTK